MIDTIHITIPKAIVAKEAVSNLSNIITIDKTTYSNSTGATAVMGYFRNFKVVIHNDNITLNGSLTKFIYGHNLVTMKPEEIMQAIIRLSKALGIPVVKGRITRLDVADNIPLKTPAIKIMSSFLETRGYVRSTARRRQDGVRYLKGVTKFAIYNKTYDAYEHPNSFVDFNSVVRLEMRIAKNVRRTVFDTLKKPLYVLHLLSPSFLRRLAKIWYKHYEKLNKERVICEPPKLSGWGDFRNYLIGRQLLEVGIIDVQNCVDVIAETNNWDSRKRRIVHSQIKSIFTNELILRPNTYIAELDEGIKKSALYKIAMNV